MGKLVHVMLSIDKEERTGVCRHCGPVKLKVKRKANGQWRYLCSVSQARWEKKSGISNPYRVFKAARCARCKFVPEHKAQLDVHHIDGNHKNDAITNLVTLCANCHRLVTWAPTLTPEYTTDGALAHFRS